MANKLIESYLELLNEGEDSNDPSMPNPYDYQSIELDPKPTNQDFKSLENWLKKMKHYHYQSDDVPTDPREWLYCGKEKDPYWCKESIRESLAFTIIDKGQRVGIINLNIASLTWASWVSGHNYATRGVMKMLDHIVTNMKSWEYYKGLKNRGVFTWIESKNIPSLHVAKKLKMEMDTSYKKEYVGQLKWPFWWIEKKHWWNK
jgi:hypothetical protein